MVGRLALAYAAGLATAIVAIIWIVPVVLGPVSIDCGELEPAACDRRWRQVAAEHSHWLPVTRVDITEVTRRDGLCGSYYIERWIFANLVTYDCL